VFKSLFKSDQQNKQDKSPQQGGAPQTAPSSKLAPLQAQGNQQLAQLDALTTLGVQDSELEVISQASLYQPLMKQVLYKFGVGRRGFRRSKQLNEFRSGLKEAAREQAREDVAAQIDGNTQLTGKSDISKNYYKLLANVESHSLAKMSVDSILQQESERIIQRLVPTDSTMSQMKQAINAKHTVPSNATPAKLKEEKKAALTTAQDKAKQLLELFADVAVNEARVITKGDKFVEGSKRDDKRVCELTSDTKEQVKKDEIGKKSIDLAVEGKSIDSCLSTISPVINQAIPEEGDEAELSFQLKIPVTTGAFVLIELGAEAANEGDHVELGTEANIGAGGSIGIAELSAKIGMFLEANGSSVSSALTLMSYGMYRHMNVLFPTIAQRLWGLGGKTGLSSLEEAELWAAAVESEHLEDAENFVSVGQQIGVDASLETGIYEGELSLKAQRYTTYNKENMELLANAYNDEQQAKANATGSGQQPSIIDKVVLFGDPGDRSKEKLAQKSELLSKLNTYKKLTVSAENKLDLGVMSFAFEGEGSLSFYNGHKDTLEASIGVDLPESIAGFSGWEQITEHVIPKIIETIGTIHKQLASNDSQSEGESDELGDLRDEMEERASQLTESLASLTDEESAVQLETESALGVSFNFEKSWDNGVPKEWKIGFDISKKSGLKLSAGVLEIELARKRKMLSLEHTRSSGGSKTEFNTYQSKLQFT